MKKILTFALALWMLTAPVFAAEYTYAEPLEPELWKEPEFSEDHAYSIAIVGDPQCLSRGDYFYGTNHMEQLFGVLSDTAEERKLKHVFVLGDITDMGYRNDANLGYGIFNPPITAEWENAQKAILQMSEAGISYSLCRGNHDDYMIDDFFNIPAYTDQFEGCGGFFSDSQAKHTGSVETRNPEGYVYWSAISGYHENSIVNSYKTMEICGTKYLFVTVDHHLTQNTIDWVDEILGKYPDHLAMVATHEYMHSDGELFTDTSGDTHLPNGLGADELWERALKKHENLLMVICGHVAADKPVYNTFRRGENGNVVRQLMVDPQGYDLREENAKGDVISGVQDTGMILYMNFSEDGKKVTFDYYSTLLNKEMKNADYPMTLYVKNPVADQGKPAVEAGADAQTSDTVTTSAPVLANSGSPALIWIPAALVVILVPVAIIFIRKKRR